MPEEQKENRLAKAAKIAAGVFQVGASIAGGTIDGLATFGDEAAKVTETVKEGVNIGVTAKEAADFAEERLEDAPKSTAKEVALSALKVGTSKPVGIALQLTGAALSIAAVAAGGPITVGIAAGLTLTAVTAKVAVDTIRARELRQLREENKGLTSHRDAKDRGADVIEKNPELKGLTAGSRQDIKQPEKKYSQSSENLAVKIGDTVVRNAPAIGNAALSLATAALSPINAVVAAGELIAKGIDAISDAGKIAKRQEVIGGLKDSIAKEKSKPDSPKYESSRDLNEKVRQTKLDTAALEKLSEDPDYKTQKDAGVQIDRAELEKKFKDIRDSIENDPTSGLRKPLEESMAKRVGTALLQVVKDIGAGQNPYSDFNNLGRVKVDVPLKETEAIKVAEAEKVRATEVARAEALASSKIAAKDVEDRAAAKAAAEPLHNAEKVADVKTGLAAAMDNKSPAPEKTPAEVVQETSKNLEEAIKKQQEVASRGGDDKSMKDASLGVKQAAIAHRDAQVAEKKGQEGKVQAVPKQDAPTPVALQPEAKATNTPAADPQVAQVKQEAPVVSEGRATNAPTTHPETSKGLADAMSTSIGASAVIAISPRAESPTRESIVESPTTSSPSFSASPASTVGLSSPRSPSPSPVSSPTASDSAIETPKSSESLTKTGKDTGSRELVDKMKEALANPPKPKQSSQESIEGKTIKEQPRERPQASKGGMGR